jgi:hypothetical protein
MKNNLTAETEVLVPLQKLLGYCRENDWSGHDPYDALNSPFIQKLPLLDSTLGRIVLTQALKLSPVNLRGALRIRRTQNPKALALFLSSFLILRPENLADREDLAREMIRRIIAKRSPGIEYWCWGYSFPWQTRREVVPTGSPNLVCTTFVGLALMDAYEQLGDPDCLKMAASAAGYIADKLFWSEGNVASFSYPQPGVRSQTHNANFLASELLCRVYKQTNEPRFLECALRVIRYSVSKQQKDGSWKYGEMPNQGWIDNFHTGYNLRALRSIARKIETKEFDSCIQRGFKFYRESFLRVDGGVRYFHDRDFPVDIHCVAESIITLMAFTDLHQDNSVLAYSVFRFAMKHMWDKRGFFYYRVLRLGKIRTSYMRWSQAWMFFALSRLLSESASTSHPQNHNSAALASV